MADFASHNTAFAQGIQRQLVKRAKEVMHKSALNPRIAEQVLYDARRTPELAARGQSIFARTYRQPNPLKGLLMAGSAGYGQLRNIHATRLNHIKELAGLRKAQTHFQPGSPEHTELASYISNKMQAFKSTMRKQFAELGAVAEPRQRFLNTTLPVGLAAGAGIAGGSVLGNIGGTASTQDTMAKAPFADRLNYLLHPNALPQPQIPPQSPGDTTSSATDTGGV